MAEQRGESVSHEPVAWNVGTLAVYNEALRQAEEKFQTERDRRYTEVNIEKEKALRIKEEADKVALGLASENQKLKEAQHNEVLNSWRDERANYATKHELTSAIEKLGAERKGSSLDARTLLFSVLGLLVLVATVISPHIH